MGASTERLRFRLVAMLPLASRIPVGSRMDEGSMIWLNVEERGWLGEGADYVPLDPGCVFAWGGGGGYQAGADTKKGLNTIELVG